MAIALVDSTSFTGTGTITSVHLNNVSAGMPSIVAIGTNQFATGKISSVTDSASNTYTKIIDFANSLSDIALWVCLNPATFTNTMTVTVTPTSGTYVVSALWAAFSGTPSSPVLDVSNTSGGNSNTMIGPILNPTTSSSELSIGIGAHNNSTTFTENGTYSMVTQLSASANSIVMDWKELTSTGNTGTGWNTSNSASYSVGTAIFKAGGGGAATVYNLGLLGVG